MWNVHLLITLSSYKFILTTALSPSPQYSVSTMFMKNFPSPLTNLWPTPACTTQQEPMALISLAKFTKYVLGKQHGSKKRKSFLFLTVGFGGHYAAFSSFLGNQLLNHPELQVVLSAHSPSQACSNWRGKMKFITVTSGNKYSHQPQEHRWHDQRTGSAPHC